MLSLCSNNHEEVCHEGRDCPACTQYIDKRKAEDLADERLETIDKLRDEIESLQEQLKALRETTIW